jgi:hypothetical protein
MYCRHPHSVVAAKGARRGEDQGCGPSGTYSSLANGLPKVRVALFYSDISLTSPSMPQSWKGSFDRVVSIEMVEAVG